MSGAIPLLIQTDSNHVGKSAFPVAIDMKNLFTEITLYEYCEIIHKHWSSGPLQNRLLEYSEEKRYLEWCRHNENNNINIGVNTEQDVNICYADMFYNKTEETKI